MTLFYIWLISIAASYYLFVNYLKIKVTGKQFIKIVVVRAVLKIIIGLFSGVLIAFLVTVAEKKQGLVIVGTTLILLFSIVASTYFYTKVINFFCKKAITFKKIMTTLLIESLIVLVVIIFGLSIWLLFKAL